MNKFKDIKINKNAFKLSDQLFFAQRLSLLLSSDVSIVEALSMMRNIDTSSNRKNIYIVIIKNIEQGMPLSKSIRNISIKFDSLLMALIVNGESSGHLAETLQQAYVYLEKRNEMKKKLISSLIYPSFIMCATILMTLFLILYIFPKIIPLLSSLNIKLPLITRIVQEFYYLSISYGLWILLLVSILVFSLYFLFKKVISLKYRLHLYFISIPFFHSYIKIYIMSSICSMGEMLLSSGKGLTDMLIFSKESSKNLAYKKVFDEIYLEAIQGISFSNSLKRYHIFFPPLIENMCAIGEKTGNLAFMLGHCSRIFEQDIDNTLKRFSSLIEPLLMILMGLIVGSVALSIILPVYEITNHLSK